MPKKKEKKAKDPIAERVERTKIDVKRELQIQELMRTTLARKWRHIVFNIQLPIMKEDIRATANIFDRVISKKNGIIYEIDRQKRFADDQSRRSLAAVMELTHLTLEQFGDVMDKMKRTYEKERDNIMGRGAASKAEDDRMWDGEENRMSVIKWADNFQFTEKYNQMYGEGIVCQYETENMMKAFLEETEDIYYGQFTDIMEQYKAELNNYNVRTEENRTKSIVLREKDDMMCQILDSQDKRLGQSQKIIGDLQLEALSFEDGTAMAEIRKRFNKYKDGYNNLRNQDKCDMEHDANQFSHLVDKSNEVIRWLESMVKKCEHIITAMNMCEIYQMATERFSSMESLYRCVCGDNKLSNIEDIAITDNLKYLFSLIVEAEITNMAMIEEKNLLKKENKELCDSIQKFVKSLK